MTGWLEPLDLVAGKQHGRLKHALAGAASTAYRAADSTGRTLEEREKPSHFEVEAKRGFR
jgi:hypothetical protein